MKYSLIFVLALCSCSRLSLEDYSAYRSANDQKYQAAITQDKTEYKVSYVPIEELVVMNSTDFPKAELKKEYKEMKAAEASSFKLRIARENQTAANRQLQKELTEYLAIDFKKDVVAVTNSGDTLHCSHYLFIPNGGMGNAELFEIDFPCKVNGIEEIIINSKFYSDSIIRIKLTDFKKEYPTLKF